MVRETSRALGTSPSVMVGSERVRRGVLAGVVATVAMSVVMIAATVTGLSPMPEPVPKAIASMLWGSGAATGLVLATAVVAHLGYGGFWGGMLAAFGDARSYGEGIALGVGLWILMGLVVLPVLGWGLFGTGITPRIAVATLVLHLIYGATLPLTARALAGSEAPGPQDRATGEGV